MANYLKFDVYDLDLKEVQCNSDLRRLLIGTGNCSLLVIEDIDCSIGLQNRNSEDEYNSIQDEKITLSGLLNFIDGLWSSCGDERIIKEHALFGEVAELLKKVRATPAEVGGELMKSDDADLALQGLINFLKSKEVQS
ncbi:hypothetical protein L484_021928 [Morus notabilis]|uniref:AAA+ ATPase At3g28540-like C-terminal domain-containing protein n=1 Tax=Morus notabilis TaxID=981085 RepID=W9S422_9ROSA|nr:hypothetical protein L484_021928 [Morus notabilis]